MDDSPNTIPPVDLKAGRADPVTTLDELLVKLLWHVEQVCGPLATEPCVVEGDDDRSVLAHNFRATLADALEAAARENERLREALEPSGDTKSAYMGEFSFDVVDTFFNEETNDFDEMKRKVYVPWTTIKEIMAAIRDRASRNALSGGPHG